MIRSALVCLVALFSTSTVKAQEDWRFRWQKGQVLDYRVQHVTAVNEVVEGKKLESSSRLNLVKRWQVLNVDDKGVATLQLSVVSLRNEQTTPSGDTLLFDSANLDKSTPELTERMKRYVGKPVAVLRVDPQGQVVETVEGSATKYEQDPPFHLILPTTMNESQSWKRFYQIRLDPPRGTGEKYLAAQTFELKRNADGQAGIALTTEIKMPESQLEQIPLIPSDVTGQIVFDAKNGRTVSTHLEINRTLENHQGANSSYHLQSQYIESLIDE